MAIAFRASAHNDTTGTSITITKPSGLTVGDLMIAVISSQDETGVSASLAGWTEKYDSDSDYHGQTTLYKIADSGDVAASNFTFSVACASDNLYGIISAYSGVDDKTPFGAVDDSAAVDVDLDFATTHDTGAVHPATSGCWVVDCMSVEGSNTSMSPRSGYTEREDSTHSAIADSNTTVSEGAIAATTFGSSDSKQSICHTLILIPSRDDAFVQKIQGSVAFANSDTSKTVDVGSTHGIIDINKSVIFYTGNYAEKEPRRSGWAPRLWIDGTTIKATFYRGAISGSSGTIYYEIWEFEGDGFKVQHGSQSISATTTNVTIDAVTLANSFPLIGIQQDSGETWWHTKSWFMVELTSTTNLQISVRAAPGGSCTCYWQVMEGEAFDVQQADLSLASGATSGTDTISSVDTSKTFLVGSAYQTDNGSYNVAAQKLMRYQLTNSTTVTGYKDVTGNAMDATVYVVEITGISATVQHSTISMDSSTTQADETISAITLANSVCILPGGAYTNYGASVGSNDSPESSFCRYSFTSTTNLRVNRIGTKSVAAEYSYFVIDFSVTAQTVTPTGISSGESMGSPTITTTVTVSPNGISSSESIGSPTVVPGAVTVTPNGIASGESIGSPTVVPGSVTITPDGIASGESIGGPTVVPGAVTVTPDGIASSESIGSPTVVEGAVTISPNGIASGESIGSPTVVPGSVTISPSGISSGESIGSPAVIGDQVVEPNGVASGEVTGGITVSVGAVTVSPNGIGSSESIGSPTVVAGPVNITPSGISSSESMGSPSIIVGSVTVNPSGIASGESMGSPKVNMTISVSGIPSGEAIGAPTVVPGAVTITPNGIASGESMGSPTIIPGSVAITPAGIPSEENIGSIIVMREGVVLPNGIISGESVGTPMILGGVPMEGGGGGFGGLRVGVFI